MNKTIKILASLVLLQFVLIVWGWYNHTGLASHSTSSALLTFQPSAIDTLLIEGDNKHVALKKVDGKWQTPSGFRADQAKVKALLDKLRGLKYSLPVATSANALQRFKVDQAQFVRHIVLQQGDKTEAELYLGSGAGARQSYVRRQTQNAVYRADIGSYDAPADNVAWQDKTVLQLDASKITSLDTGAFRFQRSQPTKGDKQPATWQALNAPTGQQLQQKALKEAIQKLASLRFSKLLGKQKEARYGMDQPISQLSLQYDKGKRHYRFSRLKDSKDYVLKTSDRDEYFQIAQYIGDGIVQGFSQDKLFKTAESDQAVTGSTPSADTTQQAGNEQ